MASNSSLMPSYNDIHRRFVMVDESQYDELSQVHPGLFVTNRVSARDIPALQKNQIKLVINVEDQDAPYKTHKEYAEAGISQVHFEMEDDLVQLIEDTCMRAFKLIKASLDKGESVVVHCAQGVNRSVAVACYAVYMLHKGSMSVLQVTNHVNEKRKVATLPNSSFREQLVDICKYEE